MNRFKTVDEFILHQTIWQEELIVLRSIINEMDLSEEIKWGIPCYTHEEQNIIGLGSFKGYFGIWFFQGALLKDIQQKLINAQEGKTQAMRQWRMSNIADIDVDLIKKYISEAINNQKEGKKVKIAKKVVSNSQELIDALIKDKILKSAFEALTAGRQKEYHEYINSAKKTQTKLARIEKCKPIIQSGRGLNDKYR